MQRRMQHKNYYQQVIGKLVKEIEQLKANNGGNQLSSPSKSSKGKKKAKKFKASFMKEKKTPKAKKSFPVAVKPPTPKRHPQQLQTGDFPAKFTPTKIALFVHIKILWCLMKQDLVPKAPDLRTLEEFYQRFRRPEEIKEAVKKSPGSN
ncbi:hypothetical protein VP01_7250g1 [Puccinia sorghi]|uniref:Uncharacterized protein n=1 Tax=Puccinia sorghi TaxID=27349 RepID=A0A0L6UD53_9BASI|nr:hypothetical protein VP01_7250g1 [Puccinia sorghi]